jgi:hypothetical protein
MLRRNCDPKAADFRGENKVALNADYLAEVDGSNLASFGQLQGQAAGFEVGASGDPGFGVVNFIAEKSGVPNQASEQLLKQWRIRIGI